MLNDHAVERREPGSHAARDGRSVVADGGSPSERPLAPAVASTRQVTSRSGGNALTGYFEAIDYFGGAAYRVDLPRTLGTAGHNAFCYPLPLDLCDGRPHEVALRFTNTGTVLPGCRSEAMSGLCVRGVTAWTEAIAEATGIGRCRPRIRRRRSRRSWCW